MAPEISPEFHSRKYAIVFEYGDEDELLRRVYEENAEMLASSGEEDAAEELGKDLLCCYEGPGLTVYTDDTELVAQAFDTFHANTDQAKLSLIDESDDTDDEASLVHRISARGSLGELALSTAKEIRESSMGCQFSNSVELWLNSRAEDDTTA